MTGCTATDAVPARGERRRDLGPGVVAVRKRRHRRPNSYRIADRPRSNVVAENARDGQGGSPRSAAGRHSLTLRATTTNRSRGVERCGTVNAFAFRRFRVGQASAHVPRAGWADGAVGVIDLRSRVVTASSGPVGAPLRWPSLCRTVKFAALVATEGSVELRRHSQYRGEGETARGSSNPQWSGRRALTVAP